LGKHVFIEKPVTLNSPDAKQLALLAREAGIIAQAGHVERFNPAFLTAQPFIMRPFYIDCQRTALFNPRGTDVSVVLDLMIHDIDLVLRLARSNIKKISASGFRVLCESEDVAEARIEFDNGSVANLRTNRAALQNIRLMEVFQEKDYLHVDLLDKKVSRAEIKEKIVPGENVLVHHRDKYMTAKNLEIQPVNAIGRELDLFAEAIADKKIPPVSLDEAYQTMKVADEIIAQIRKP
jgi:predicted dehydrogenase